MSTPIPTNLADRVAALERQLVELRTHIVALERAIAPREEHPVDREVVREKVSYDWQS